jgi:ribosomal protein L37AE/L43A
MMPNFSIHCNDCNQDLVCTSISGRSDFDNILKEIWFCKKCEYELTIIKEIK